MMDHTSDLEKQVQTLRKRSIFTLFLTWLALFFTIIGIAAGYKNFLRVHDKAKEARDDAKVAMALVPQMASKASIENWQREIRSQLVATQAQSTMELKELKSLKASNDYTETALKQQIEQLTQQQLIVNKHDSHANNHPTQHWQIADIRYLLNVASRNLTLNHDAKTAIAALKAADSELITLGEPKLLPLRRLIAKDIANLQVYKSVDLSTIILAIDDVAKQLDHNANLRLVNDVASMTDQPNHDDTTDKPDSLLNRMKARLDDAVVIKRYDNKLAKKIKGDTQQVRYELIRLKLESLKLMALKSQSVAYQAQLKQLSELLNQEQAGLLDDSILAALAKLKTLTLEPTFPTLLADQLLDELLLGVIKGPL